MHGITPFLWPEPTKYDAFFAYNSMMKTNHSGKTLGSQASDSNSKPVCCKQVDLVDLESRKSFLWFFLFGAKNGFCKMFCA